MIPTRDQCLLLFDRYQLPSTKKIHVEEVCRLALYFVDKLQQQKISVDRSLVEAAALLHDIDKAIPKKAGERHPDTAVRTLLELGFTQVAEVVKKHSVHLILDSNLMPKTWEEKIVFLADKMVKHEIIGVEHRFALWFKEQLPEQAVAELNASKPKVKALEQEVYLAGKFSYNDVVKDLKNT